MISCQFGSKMGYLLYYIHACIYIHVCIWTYPRSISELQDRINFNELTGLWSMMDMAYYSYVQIYVFWQKIDGHEVSDSLSVLQYIVHRNN